MFQIEFFQSVIMLMYMVGFAFLAGTAVCRRNPPPVISNPFGETGGGAPDFGGLTGLPSNTGQGATPNTPGFTGSDFRCRANGGECKSTFETCCPGGWLDQRICAHPYWCCSPPKECETNGGTCQIPDEVYCPGSYNTSLSCGSIFAYEKCCLKDSPCETDYLGRCVADETKCTGNSVLVQNDQGPLCGTDANYKCCVTPPVVGSGSACIVGRKKLFCDFLSTTNMTFSTFPNNQYSAQANINQQCQNGNAQRATEQCGEGTVCLRPQIIDYLSCMQRACPNAEVISLTSNTRGYESNRPFCRGKAVGLKIDMDDQPASCDISNIQQFCHEMKGSDFVLEQEGNIYYLTCVF